MMMIYIPFSITPNGKNDGIIYIVSDDTNTVDTNVIHWRTSLLHALYDDVIIHQQLKALGITGSEERLLGLLKAADYNVERAVNQ